MRKRKITKNIKDQILILLQTTNLSCKEIGKKFGVSRGPVSKIKQESKIIRDNPRKQGKYLQCKICDKSFYFPKGHEGRGRGKFCSKQCYSQWQKTEENSRENNPNWKDNCKHEDYWNHLRKSTEWEQWRKIIFERDNYTCQICGVIGSKLHPHHILLKVKFPEYIFDIRNGITLCSKCHKFSGIHKHKTGWINLLKRFNEAQLMHL